MGLLERKYCIIRRDHLEKTEEFFKKYGGVTIVIARFVPFIRTFAPFLAGVGKMSYRWFVTYNIIGGVLWVLFFTLAGFFFGNLPIVQENFNYVIYAIIALSLFAVASIIVGVVRSMRVCPLPSPEERKP
jgi:membrane-associated protein